MPALISRFRTNYEKERNPGSFTPPCGRFGRRRRAFGSVPILSEMNSRWRPRPNLIGVYLERPWRKSLRRSGSPGVSRSISSIPEHDQRLPTRLDPPTLSPRPPPPVHSYSGVQHRGREVENGETIRPSRRPTGRVRVLRHPSEREREHTQESRSEPSCTSRSSPGGPPDI